MGSYPFRKLASTIWCVLYFIEEHGIIECQAEPDWMRWLHLAFSDLERFIICLLRLVNYLCNPHPTCSTYSRGLHGQAGPGNKIILMDWAANEIIPKVPA